MASTKSTLLPNPRRDGDPISIEWIASNCDVVDGPLPSPCIVWKGTHNGKGYGLVWHERRMRAVHVVAMELRNLRRPDGMEWDHLCSNRACIREDHLQLTTHLENVRRSFVRGNRRRSQKTRTQIVEVEP